MCEKYYGDRGFLWRSVGLPAVAGEETVELPDSNNFPCSNPGCEVRFKMPLGIFCGDHVFCTSKCLIEWEEKP